MAKEQISKIRIALVNLHGLIRGHDPELGRDPDTGGQTKYVLELATALSHEQDVEEVVILTRQVLDQKVSSDYARLEEQVSPKLRIVRIPFGPKRYLRKERLWSSIDTFIDRAINYFRREGRLPHVFHGHYAESGYAAAQLARLLMIPCIFTGHSLGRVKRDRLVAKGKEKSKIQNEYAINQRIEAEEFALDTASLVITSTMQEVEEQYKLYEQYDPSRMEVIPPGVDLSAFQPPGNAPEDTPLTHRIESFLTDPDKPVILAIARPDERKNFTTLIEAYGESAHLRDLANLVIIAGNRDDLRAAPAGQRRVLTQILTLIDVHNLYGSVAYPKNHRSEEIPILYRWAASRRGVFINPALTEPFGLTLLESSASGLPFVATNDGGPRDIVGLCQNGILVDPLSKNEIDHGLQRLFLEKGTWQKFSENGLTNVRKYYTWDRHASRYIKDIKDLLQGMRPERFMVQKPVRALKTVDRLVITDVDNTLTGDDEALQEYIRLIESAPENVGFGIATGRTKQAALELLEELNVPKPQLLVCSVGTEIYYGEDLTRDQSWNSHILYEWKPAKIKKAFSMIKGVYLQPESHQSAFKLSYTLDKDIAPSPAEIRRLLRNLRLKAKIVFSLGMYLDILPIRAGDGLAVRHLAYRWGLPSDKILIAGDSGNDEEMLKGDTLGVVVGNYSPELKKLKGYERVYFADRNNAGGIVEGIEYYNFLDKIVIPNEKQEEKQDEKKPNEQQ